MSGVVSLQSRGSYLTHTRGVRSWLLTRDHKRIGVMYLVAVMVFLVVGGLFALLGASSQARSVYNQMAMFHGMVMLFLVAVPAIPATLGNVVIPLMLGAKGVAFPRLNLLGFYLYCIGATILVYVFSSGVIHLAFGKTLPGGFSLTTSWTSSIPYGAEIATRTVIAVAISLLILALSATLSAVTFIVTIQTLRPPGMTWFRMPLFLWAIYGAGIIHIIANGIFTITLLLIIAERTRHVGIFDPVAGGDPVLFQHFFWFYANPLTYIMILPALGIISEIVSTFSRKHIFGYKFIAYSLIAMALLGFFAWGQHLFVSGQSGLVNSIFSLLTFSIAIPSGILLCNWIHTLYRGSIRLQTPMLYAIGFIVIFAVGTLSGLFLGALSVGVHLTKTSFDRAHFYYVSAGPTLFAFLAGMYYWWPKITGKMVCEKWSRIAAGLVFTGFNLAFFPMFVVGSRGMPGRYAGDRSEYRLLQVTSSVGGYVMSAGLLIVLLTWLRSLFRGRNAPANPWGANSLEWQTSSPPPFDNIVPASLVGDPYDLSGWRFVSLDEGWLLNAESPDDEPAQIADSFRTEEPSNVSGRLGVWLLLCTPLLMFAGLAGVYGSYRYNYPRVFAYAHQFIDKRFGIAATVLLIAGSFWMAWAARCAQLGKRGGLVVCLVLTLLSGIGVMRVKILEYSQQKQHHLLAGAGNRYHKDYAGDLAADQPKESAETPVPAGEDAEVRRQGPADLDPLAGTPDEPRIKPSFNSAVGMMAPGAAPEPAGRHLGYKDLDKAERTRLSTFFSIYDLMTGLHGLHLLLGLCLLIWVLLLATFNKPSSACSALIPVISIYWQLMTAIWLFLFPLIYLIH